MMPRLITTRRTLDVNKANERLLLVHASCTPSRTASRSKLLSQVWQPTTEDEEEYEDHL